MASEKSQTTNIQLFEDVISKGKESIDKLRSFEIEIASKLQDNHLTPRIENEISEMEMLQELVEYLELVDAERHRLKFQVRRLNKEVQWLRNELQILKDRCIFNESQVVELEVRLQHETFLKGLSKQDVPETPSQKTNTVAGNKSTPISNSKNQNSQAGFLIEIENVASSLSNMPEVPNKLKTLHNLVVQYASQRRFEVAVPLCKQAIEDLEKIRGHNDHDVATMLNILALVYRDQGKFKESEAMLNDTLNIREHIYGKDHDIVASTLNNLAVLYGKRGKYKEAEPLCFRALEIREKVLGPDHPGVAKQLNNLALLCQNQSKYDEVEKYYKRAIEIYSSLGSNEDTNIAKTRNNLAACLMKQGRYPEAETLYKMILSKVLVGESDKTIWSVAEEAQEQAQAVGLVSVASPPVSNQTYLGRLSASHSISSFSESIMSESNNSGSNLPVATNGVDTFCIGGLVCVGVDNSTLLNTIRNLCIIYRRQNKIHAAQKLEELLPQTEQQNIFGFQRYTIPHNIDGINSDIAGMNASALNSLAKSNISPQYQSQPQLNKFLENSINLRSDFFRSSFPAKQPNDIAISGQRSALRQPSFNSLQQITDKFTARFGSAQSSSINTSMIRPPKIGTSLVGQTNANNTIQKPID